ncbi:SGT1 protein-domain-containing protein [Neohortaea acidophila]|uniref:SGT1 protein-domain-containing protein n=1 Tax=Neohortaea acidophila TaxID=245834 RepID=A0A6A6PPS0_9PEZI|nr:SGT1 protein-domain-containing protein [Neohortaea acidophila]KAF2481796.1 SGT1 protein-domain-containing protein [Neohortaea acidophila]
MDIPTEDDGLKWFGEGFDGFPKRLPDDCAEYVIYIINEELSTAAAVRARLNDVLKASKDLAKKLLKDYIWQRDVFELKLPSPLPAKDAPEATKSSPPHLRGRTNFGDSVADEWLIVYLLLELSKQFPDAWMRVYDTDGEFLLIEAANALPKWLNPDIAENRVWISNGHLRIIPIAEGAVSSRLSLKDALSFVQQHPEKLSISPFIEDEAFYRLREYPAAISSSLHHALVSIPRTLAYILRRDSAYISPAIEAFYLRDPVGLRPLATKDISTLRFPPEDFVSVSVKFTKVGYAQLRSQIFDPPPAWTAVVPRMEDAKVATGMKLACGFEMLLSDPQNQDKRVVREMKLLLEDVESGEETLPSDAEIAAWPQIQDDEKWLDIDYNDFENVLSGEKGKASATSTGKGKPDPHDNLRKMVSRFEDFLKDDNAGAEGVDDVDDDDEPNSDSASDGESEINEEEFNQAVKAIRSMQSEDIEKNGLLDEARKLALEDAEDQSDVDEDEEMKKVMALMEQELKGHGALNLNDDSSKFKKPAKDKPRRASQASAEEEIGPGDGELSSDDEEFNDVDLGLAKNMLESFKGQVGMAGPAGNLMHAMGVQMPRDEGSDSE